MRTPCKAEARSLPHRAPAPPLCPAQGSHTADRGPDPAPRLASPRARASPPEGGWLRPQAERDLLRAAQSGDLATLKRLVEEGVNLEAKDGVSAALSQPPPSPPPPLAVRPRRPPPLLPRPHSRR